MRYSLIFIFIVIYHTVESSSSFMIFQRLKLTAIVMDLYVTPHTVNFTIYEIKFVSAMKLLTM